MYIYVYGLLRLQGFNSVKSILLFLFSFSVWINLNSTILVVGEFHIQTLDSYILSTCMVSVSNMCFLSKIVSGEPRVTAWHARGRICSSWNTAVLQVKCLEHLPQKQMVGLWDLGLCGLVRSSTTWSKNGNFLSTTILNNSKPFRIGAGDTWREGVRQSRHPVSVSVISRGYEQVDDRRAVKGFCQ